MKHVGDKPESLRRARAQARLDLPPECIALVRQGSTEKGELLATARIAGIMAAKRTDDILPLCHPLPLQGAEVRFTVTDDHVLIETEVQTLGSTGVEMEALTAASVAALALYDMLKPHTDPLAMRIQDCRLLDKTGGKSQHRRRLQRALPASLLCLSEEGAGPVMKTALTAAGFAPVEVVDVSPTALDAALRERLRPGGPRLLLTLGGLAPQARTLDVVRPHLDAELPGLVETARVYAQRRVPKAMFTRGIAGVAGETLLISLPGQIEDAQRAWTPLLPGLIAHFEPV